MYSPEEEPVAADATSGLQRVYETLAALPLGWLVLLALFTLTVSLQQGHFPIYGNPDPKDTGPLLVLYYPLLVLLPGVLASIPVTLAMTLLSWWPRFPLARAGRTITVWALGALLFVSIAAGDFAGLMTWLAD